MLATGGTVVAIAGVLVAGLIWAAGGFEGLFGEIKEDAGLMAAAKKAGTSDGQAKGPKSDGGRVVSKGKQPAGKADAAYAKLEELHSSDPTFLPAACLLADLLRQRNQVPKARELYLSASKVDVDLLPAKRGLYLCGA